MSDTPPNITLVSIDSLRGDHCGYLGDGRGLTPELDELADEGVAFENAIATGPQTFSSMPSVFTGERRPPTSLENHPQESHWERRLSSIEGHLRRYTSLAERLQALGYETAGVTPNPWTSMASSFDRGFDRFVDFSDRGSEGWPHEFVDRIPGVDADSRSVTLLLNMLAGSEFFAQWEDLYNEILQAREGLSEPYFLWVFILDTHFPFITSRTHREEQSLLGIYTSAYQSSEAMRGNAAGMADNVRESTRRSYRDTVRASDAFLGRLRSDLAADDPVFMVHSDHGESFGEHDNYGHHHRQVYEENVHVPYVVHNAGVSADVSAPTSLTTVYDTALSIARDGTFEPTAMADSHVIAASECGTNRAVRGSRFKYIEQGDERFLFDLDADPKELMDLSEQLPKRCETLRQQLTRLDRHTSETERLHRATKTVASHGSL